MAETLLVVADRTVAAEVLLAAVESRAAGREVAVTLLVPVAARGREDARRRLDAALARLHASGVRASGRLGAESPAIAVEEEADARYDEVLLGALPEAEAGAGGWLASGLAARIERLAGAPVNIVEVPAGQAAPALGPPPPPKPLLEGMLDELHVDTNEDTGPLRG